MPWPWQVAEARLALAQEKVLYYKALENIENADGRKGAEAGEAEVRRKWRRGPKLRGAGGRCQGMYIGQCKCTLPVARPRIVTHSVPHMVVWW